MDASYAFPCRATHLTGANRATSNGHVTICSRKCTVASRKPWRLSRSHLRPALVNPSMHWMPAASSTRILLSTVYVAHCAPSGYRGVWAILQVLSQKLHFIVGYLDLPGAAERQFKVLVPALDPLSLAIRGSCTMSHLPPTSEQLQCREGQVPALNHTRDYGCNLRNIGILGMLDVRSRYYDNIYVAPWFIARSPRRSWGSDLAIPNPLTTG